MIFPFILTIILLITIIKNEQCTIDDYGQFFSNCDIKTNTRNITIYLKSNCSYENLNTNNNTLLSIYSKLPTFTIYCNHNCLPGEIIYYNIIENKIECKKCPKNTYSTSGNLIIDSNWNETHLNLFQTNCYAIDNEGAKKNEDCTKLHISNDNSILMTGEIIGNQTNYLIQILYFFNTQNPGRIIVKYKKDIIIENGLSNGDLSIYFDYELIENVNIDNNFEWEYIIKDFNAGEHEIVFFYSYMKNLNKKPLRLYINQFEIIGLNQVSFTCEKCINSVSPEGSEKCFYCDINSFYDNQLEICFDCPVGEFFSKEENKCVKIINCNNFDYEIYNISECVDNVRNISFVPIESSFCRDKDLLEKNISIDCFDDNINYSENENEYKCSSGMIYSSYFIYDFKTILINDFFDENIGFYGNDKGIFSGNFINTQTIKILKKYFVIKQTGGSIKISLELNLSSYENINIKINKKNYYYSKIKNNITIYEVLQPGKISLSIKYEKISNFQKLHNSILISEIIIIGSNLTKKKQLLKCPIGTISTNNCSKCELCKENEIPNESQTFCVKCKNGVSKYINSQLVCEECPLYTYFNGEKCLLNEVILQSFNLLRFYLYPIKEYINRVCLDQSGLLCYENSFIGPVNIKLDLKEIEERDLFFISLFESKQINIYDFNHDDKSNEIKSGFIFGLFNSKNFQSKIETNKLGLNLTNSNMKIKKNLASSIKKIEILPKSIDANRKLGLFIEYEEGDICLSDSNKNYKSYLYLKCNKYEISSPKLIKTKDNNCTYIFEWPSPNACKNCLTKEISFYDKGTCRYGKRVIIFSSDDDCLIFNVSKSNLNGGNIEYYNKLCEENCDLYNIIIDDKNKNKSYRISDNNHINGNIIKAGDFNFKFDFIENSIYYQKCTFLENIEGKWIKYIIIIPIVYFITFIGIIVYCIKYRKIKNRYQRLNSDMSRNEIVRKSNLLNTQDAKTH